jgi:serine/threonine-protein kinase
VTVPATGESWTLAFTVLEYVPGSTLEDLLAKAGPEGLGIDRTRRLLRHVVLALEAVHAQNVVHRDLKPSNILVDASGGQELAKVTDFGLAKLTESNFAKTTALAGATVGYAPPEQFEYGNARVGRHTDVFSLAAIVYEMLCGKPAFPFHAGDHPLLVLTKILNAARPSLAKVSDSLPRGLQTRPDAVAAIDAELARAMSPEPSARHETVTSFWERVDRTLGSMRDSTAPIGPGSGVIRVGVAREDAPLSAAATMFADSDPSKTAVMLEPPAELRASVRVPAAAPASRSAQWTWRMVTPTMRAGAVRAASFARAGEGVAAVGSAGILMWSDGHWTKVAADSIDASRVRGLAWAGADVIAVGELSLVARVRAQGGVAMWSAAAPDIAHNAAHVDADGTATIVGERPDVRGGASSTHATIVVANETSVPSIVDVANIARLRSVTRVGARTFIACGDGGMLVAFENGAVTATSKACAADLTAIAALPDGSAVVAGKGGFVFQVWPDLKVKLEAIQTTRDLFTVAVDGTGCAWTGGAQARVLRRGTNGWVRVGADIVTSESPVPSRAAPSSSIVSLWASTARVVAVCDDGAVLEGALR